MKTYTKNYIGKGKKVAKMDIVTVAVKVDELMKNSFEYDGVLYAKFEVAALKEADNYGNTHTVYFSKAETVEEEKYQNSNFAKRRKAEKEPKESGKTKKDSKKAKEKLSV